MLKLHFAPNSRAGRIVWLFEELGLEYELNKMAFHPKDLKSDEHRQRHPLGRVPVLEDGDVSIYESGAIVEYVMARYGDGGLKPAVRPANLGGDKGIVYRLVAGPLPTKARARDLCARLRERDVDCFVPRE